VLNTRKPELTILPTTTKTALVNALDFAVPDFAALANALPAMVFQVRVTASQDIQVEFVSYGVKWLFDLEPQEVRANPRVVLKAIVAEDAPSFFEAMRAANLSGKTWNWDGRIQVQRTQEVKWINWRARLLDNVQDGASVWCGLATNITQSKLNQLELQRAHARLRDLSDHLEQRSEAQRAAMAREIHDDMGATLAALKFSSAALGASLQKTPGLDAARYEAHLHTIHDAVDAAIEGMRRVCADLRPPLLDLGLEPALETYLAQFAARTKIACKFESALNDLPVAEPLAGAIFRLIQEALTNVVKHAQATQISVTLTHERGAIRFSVIDNGRGFQHSPNPPSGRYGLRGMRERVAALDGQILIDSAPGHGTQIHALLPCVRVHALREPEQAAMVDIGPRASVLPPVQDAAAALRDRDRQAEGVAP
jgi:two-component system, NarL family, sensor histidine kinase UhpB